MKTQSKITDQELADAGHDMEDAATVRALCEYLDCGPEDLSKERHDHYGLAVFSLGSKEYAIGTDTEADEASARNIEGSAWAFNASFLASFTDLPEEVFTAMQDKCEGANDAFVKLIERTDGGMKAFVAEAISADGRGHFMSSYDGNENEAGEFYVYRVN